MNDTIEKLVGIKKNKNAKAVVQAVVDEILAYKNQCYDKIFELMEHPMPSENYCKCLYWLDTIEAISRLLYRLVGMVNLAYFKRDEFGIDPYKPYDECRKTRKIIEKIPLLEAEEDEELERKNRRVRLAYRLEKKKKEKFESENAKDGK